MPWEYHREMASPEERKNCDNCYHMKVNKEDGYLYCQFDRYKTHQHWGCSIWRYYFDVPEKGDRNAVDY